MNLQKINIKLFTDATDRMDLDPFLDIFARWRQDRNHDSGWVDLADYAHVEKGPGVMLIGERGNLSFDLADPGPGLLYANKLGLEGRLEDRIREAFRRSFDLFVALIGEKEYPATFRPRPGFWELSFNDRLETPNADSTDRALRRPVETVLGEVFGEIEHTLIRQPDAQRRFGFVFQSDAVPELDQLATRVQTV